MGPFSGQLNGLSSTFFNQGNQIMKQILITMVAVFIPVSVFAANPIIPDLISDPSIVEFDGTFYCYATTDRMGAGLATAELPMV